MAQSRQTPRVWSDAIRGSEILANWVKLGSSAVVLWLSIGIALGGSVGTLWFAEGTTSLDRKLWLHHVRSSLGMGGRIADLPDPDGSGTRIQVAKAQVQRYTWRSYDSVTRRLQESLLLSVILAIGGTVTAAFFLRQSGRSATENQHIRGATLAPTEAVIALAKASRLAYDITLAGVLIFRESETDHILVCGASDRTTVRATCRQPQGHVVASYSASCSGTISFGSPVSSASSRTGTLLVALLHSRRQLICPSPVWFQKATKRHALTGDNHAGIQLARGTDVPGREAPGSSQSVTIAALGECRKATTFLSPPTDCERGSEWARFEHPAKKMRSKQTATERR